MRWLRTVLWLISTLLPLAAFGQINPTEWTAKPGSQPGTIEATATIEEGWYIYGTRSIPDGPFPTTFKSPDGKFEVAGPVQEPGIGQKFDEGFEKEVDYFEKTGTYVVPLKAAGSDRKGSLTVTFQACNANGCLPPQDVEMDVELVGDFTGAAGTTEPPSGAAATDAPVSQAEQAKAAGLLTFFGTAIAAGLLALLTPCVFPMIPITVSIFSKKGRTGGIAHATAFCLGIISTFTLLGLAFTLLFGASGLQNFANSAWLNMFLGLLFVVLALGLFGVYEFTLPSGITNRFNPQGKAGLVGPVLMGLVFSLTSFTCTMPFVGTLLVSAAQGDLLFPIVGMLGFSIAFSIPFFLLALFPQYLSKLPKSGGWLSVVKAFMGFIELAAAVKFFSSVDLAWQLGWITKPVFLALWATIMTVAGAYLFGWLKIPTVDESGKPGPLRLAFGAGSIILAGMILNAINGGSLGKLASFLPPDPYPYREGSAMAQKNKAEDGWFTSYDEALLVAKEQNRPLFIDFTGVFCTNCRDMERNVFPVPEIQAEFEKFVLVKLYTDRPDNPNDQRYQKMKIDLTKSVANPVYAILTPDEELVSFSEYQPNVGMFREFLAAAATKSGLVANR